LSRRARRHRNSRRLARLMTSVKHALPPNLLARPLDEREGGEPIDAIQGCSRNVVNPIVKRVTRLSY
jgi:hypothetical protein